MSGKINRKIDVMAVKINRNRDGDIWYNKQKQRWR